MTPSRHLISGTDARAKVTAGIDKGANAVKHTFGPFGTNGLLEKGNRITNDGITILREITLDDEVEDRALSKLKDGVAKSNDVVGDASTTFCILVQAVLKESNRLLGNGKSIGGKMTTGQFLRKLKAESAEVVEKLKEAATPITSKEQLINSAIVSVEDDTLGELIGSMQWELGPDGYILAEEVPETTTTIERVSGVKIDNGIAASFLINNQEKQMLEISDARTILTSHTLQSLEPLKDILDALLKQKVRHVAVFARGWSEQAIADCAANAKNGYFVYPLNAAYTNSKEVMIDLASVLGGTFLDHEQYELEDAQLSDVGFASKIRARLYDAVITGKEDPANRIATLKEQLSGSVSDFEKKMLTSRIAQLEHGFAVVQVGAENETERKRVFDKVEDAVNATRAALQEGTVKGGGLAFKEIAETLPDDYILKRPLSAAHEQLFVNAPDDFVIEDWVRDPLEVLRIALEQAVSLAGDLATVYTVITTKKDRYNAYVSNEKES